jgi:hypothetical protein
MNGVSAGLVHLTKFKPRDSYSTAHMHPLEAVRSVIVKMKAISSEEAGNLKTIAMITSDVTFRDRSFTVVQHATFVIEREIAARVHVHLI